MPIKGDFISFSYNGVHSTELGVMRVTSSNRYTDALLPTIQDKTVLASGSDGTYFFGSYYTLRPITINVAFDEVSESLIRLMRKTFGDGLSHELIFDDEPYKVYYAKATGIPLLQYIPFSTPRVYKGEGTFTFICYDPFAHCKNSLKYLSEFPDATTNVEMNGNIIGFNNGVENFKKVEVEIEPMQDLHGYANPWPDGGGKNLVPTTLSLLKSRNPSGTWNDNVYTISGITFTVNDDGTITVNGTSTDTIFFNFIQNASRLPITTGSYIIHATGNADINLSVGKDGSYWGQATTSNTTITADADAEISCYSAITSGKTLTNFVLKPMFEKGTTASEWEPYENICSISGLTGLSVYRTGKNLLDFENKSLPFNGNRPYIVLDFGEDKTFPELTLTFFMDGARYSINSSAICDYLKNDGTHQYRLPTAFGLNSANVNTGAFSKSEANITFRKLVVYLGTNYGEYTAGTCSIQLELGSPTAYEPYNGNIYSVDWSTQAGTVYGGTLDVVTGLLVVDKGCVNVSSSWSWEKSNSYPGGFYVSVDNAGTGQKKRTPFMCSHAKTVTSTSQYIQGTCYCDEYINIRIMGGSDTVQDWKNYINAQSTAGTPLQICYELATPLTYQLIPQEISTLSGLNYIWSNLETNIDIVYKRLTGITELFKLEWNPSALLLESKGIYDSYNSSTGFKLYNPGDLEANFKFKVPISASIGGIKIDDGNNHDLESHILMLNGNTITPKGNDTYLLFNSRTNLIEGLDANGARTMNLYNEYISSGHWFKIPMNESNKTWYFVPINYSGDTPVLEYDYLYF